LVDDWIKETGIDKPQQKVLQKIIERDKIKVFELPLSYCYIETLPNGQKPNIKIENPVISHYQASRKTKNNRLLRNT